ncbi:MAG TPA: hypothetical protein VD861_21530 [Pyrinomonadaceae bacterium]|nr:hypothetical protein [Pyrinomonadaceae bacterium]
MRNKLRWPVTAFMLLGAFITVASGRSPYRGTRIVGPTRDDPVAGGNSLLQVLQHLKNAGSGTAANPWLLKIEPGIYDLGTNVLQLLPYVDVEGSGQGVTTIIGRGSSTTAMANFVELRSLTIKNMAVMSSAAGVTLGLGSPRLSDLSILMSGANMCTGSCNGVAMDVTSTPTLTDVRIKVTSSSTQNRGISCGNKARGRLSLTGVAIEVSGASTYNDGIVFTGSGLNDPPLTLTMADSSITVSGPATPGSSPVGISSYKDILRLTGVTINSGYIGVALAGYGKSELTIDRSTIQGLARASVSYGGQKGFARIGGSKLVGPVEGRAKCAASYNGQYLPLDAACK